MSGIAGIIHFDGKPVEPGLIEKMTGAMAHRGPDGIHHWVKGSVALGQCMLRTTPESLEEHQPLTNEDESLVLVMDGRVDNWEELRKELLSRGSRLRTCADAELVLRAYEIWTEECPDRIIGEYVFFVWDTRQRRLFGARDAVGTRHFYYHSGDGWFAFASEIKGLLALDRIQPRLNESKLLDYLLVEFDRDDEVGTFYMDISRLPAGHAMISTERGAKIWRFWDPVHLPALSYGSYSECADAFLEQLCIAVGCRLRSNGRVGAMLSGGLDSSSIVGLISSKFRDRLNSPLRTFSLIRDDRENCPDWLSIREILKANDWFLSTVITSAIPSAQSRDYINHIKDLNEPFDLTNGLTDSLVYKAAQENGCGIVLDGMAADLLFYSPQKSLDYACRMKGIVHIPSILEAHRRHRIKNGLTTVAWKLLRAGTPVVMLALYRNLRDRIKLIDIGRPSIPGNLVDLLNTDIARQHLNMRRFNRRREECSINADNDQISHAQNFKRGMVSFAHEVNGRLALSYGVEPRSPFSDRRVVEFALQMPMQAKLSLGWYKLLLRRTMAGILPESVRWRQTLGAHPGWRFFESFVQEYAASFPELWSCAYPYRNLDRWIDARRLSQAQARYNCDGDYVTGFNLFTVAVLAQWLDHQLNLTPSLNFSATHVTRGG